MLLVIFMVTFWVLMSGSGHPNTSIHDQPPALTHDGKRQASVLIKSHPESLGGNTELELGLSVKCNDSFEKLVFLADILQVKIYKKTEIKKISCVTQCRGITWRSGISASIFNTELV